MPAIIGAVLFGVIALMTLGVSLGLPLGEYTLGGKYKILPMKMRAVSGLSFAVQMLAILVILQTGKIAGAFFPQSISRGLCFFFAVYLSLNTVMNFFSDSRKEKLVMTPLAFLTAICFWYTALLG